MSSPTIPNNPLDNEPETEKEKEEVEKNDTTYDYDNDTNKKSNNEILLKLGDIIIISEPTNEILNNNVFLIEYIDPHKIKLINSETFEKTILQISEDRIIGDGHIEEIKVISSNPSNGFARQNDLLPGTWINIYFGGEIPTIITGKITNLEEDMIEIRTTDNDTIFINFAYQGIPEDLPIETFEIRPPIQEPSAPNEDDVNVNDIEGEGEDKGEDKGEGDNLVTEIPIELVKENIQKLIFNVSDIEIGEVINVEEFINVNKEKHRYNIEAQTNDLLEEMLSTIPNHKRTNNVLNNIHIMITRFLQLRETSSTFDNNHNITGVIQRDSEHRPLANYLAEFKNTLYWIMMVAKNVKKIYPPPKPNQIYTQYDDYETLNLKTDLNEMSSLYITRQSTRNLKARYSSFTFKTFDKYMTPFYSLNPDTFNDVFAEPNGIIIEGNVNTDINVIIDNLGDLYSNVVANSEINNRRFIIQKYNLGLEKLHADSFKGQNLITHRVKVEPNDPISINSIITLPEPMVRFSQINLPGSNLLVKANLNLHFLNYWQLLKQQTDVTKITIDGLDNEIEYDDSNFVDNIKQYLLNLSDYERPTDLTNLDIYKIFLQTIIPKIRVLFSLVKKYIKGKLSLVDVVSYLEPFMIYPVDLTYMQFREINKFIYDKIKEYNTKFKECGMAFSSLRYTRYSGKKTTTGTDGFVFQNPLFNIFTDNMHTPLGTMNKEVMDTYGYNNTRDMHISGSEFLKSVTIADYGNLFNNAVAFNNVELMFPQNLSNIFNNDTERMKQIIEKDKTNDKCSSLVIAKKYYSTDALNADNGKLIYYDKEFDTTNYDIIETKYKKEKDSLSSEDLVLFLANKFMTKDNMDKNTAEYMATTLVSQAKKVREGDYALLITNFDTKMGEINADEMEYYVRKNDIWVLDNVVDPKTFIKDTDILCNIDYSCVYNPTKTTENKCESTELTKDTIVQNTLTQIIEQFDKNYNISKTELNSILKKNMEYYMSTYDNLQKMKKTNALKNNKQQYELGLSVSDETKNIKVSPHTKLRDLIVGQNDFIKRQNDILRFVSLYCYEGNPSMPNINDGEMEDEWWYYCNETNTKLLPKFYYILASTFVTNNSNYDEVLNNLKKQIGKISDDGDAWVDVHSGEVMCQIDFDVSEGYNDGFINKSRDIIEKDIGEIMLEKHTDAKNDKRLSPEGGIVSNMISVLSSNMGIDVEISREFMIRVVTELMSDVNIIEKEPAYRKREEEAAKKGKKLPSYGVVYSSTILYLTLGIFLIAIQTSIPPIQTRKTAPGCIRSFSGFPFEGEGDDSSLHYVACVAIKSRDPSTIPWNVLQKNEDKTANTIKSFIIRYLLPYGEVIQKIKTKTEYLLVNPPDLIPDEHNLSKWHNFLPPLTRFHINHLNNITDGFTEELQNELLTGNYRQIDKILVIQSKIIAFSFAIQETIQKIVDKKELLLKSAGQLFMDNACCNETSASSVTSFQYFINDDQNIEIYNNIVYNLSAFLRDIKTLTQSAIMLSDINTKRTFPTITTDFSEETMYRTFIMLCKFHSSVPLTEELSAICIDKPDYLNKMDTIQEKIAKLKRDGRNYTKEQFLRLFQLVSRNNIINISFGANNVTCVDYLNKILQHFDKTNDENVPKALTQKLEQLVEKSDISIKEDIREMRNLKDYLQTSNATMKTELLEFIKFKSNSTTIEIKNMTKFIENISIWKFDESPRNIEDKISDDGMYNYTQFMKTYIELFAVVFPSMIINQQLQTIIPAEYWKLSMDHENDIKNMVLNYYKPIEKFYGNNTIKNVLNEIMIKSKSIYLLSQNMPILTNIKLNNTEIYNVFDKRTITLLYEYYLLSVLTDYIYLTKTPNMVSKMLLNPDKGDNNIFTNDFLLEQQMRFNETEQEFIEGDVMKLNTDVAKLLVSYLQIMMRAKKTINVAYSDVEDKVFKLKEAEKYDFTDKLKDMSDEARAVDTILKHHKLGALYSLGMSKGIKEYDIDQFEYDKQIAENVAKIQRNLNRNGLINDDMDLDDTIEQLEIDRDIELDNAMDMNPTDDYNDGDPWGDEGDNFNDYD